jgi:hypothetical protein
MGHNWNQLVQPRRVTVHPPSAAAEATEAASRGDSVASDAPFLTASAAAAVTAPAPATAASSSFATCVRTAAVTSAELDPQARKVATAPARTSP